MKSLFVIILVVINTYNVFSQSDEKILANIYQMTLKNSPIYENLRYLTKKIGNRINGSPQLAAAIEFTRQLMIEYQFDSVYLQPVMVPNWTREKNEIVKIINSPSLGNQSLNCIALGNSIGTGDEGLVGEVIEINGMDELKKTDKNLVNGKIVFLNQTLDNSLINILEGYSKVFNQRTLGASQASIKGAKAVIIRSITTGIDDSPHTGNIFYEDGVKKIPAVTISTKDADMLSKHCAYPQFWPLLQPLLFWGASFDKLPSVDSTEGLRSRETIHDGVETTVQTGGECQTDNNG